MPVRRHLPLAADECMMRHKYQRAPIARDDACAVVVKHNTIFLIFCSRRIM